MHQQAIESPPDYERPQAPILPGAEPFVLEGGENAVLLLHGFTGSPWAMRYIGPRLHEAGFTVSAPLLPGHGTSPNDLLPSRFHLPLMYEWIAAAESAWGELNGAARTLTVIGFSMGSLLALEVARRHPEEVDGLMLCGLPLVVDSQKMWLPARLGTMFGMGDRIYKIKDEVEMADREKVKECPTYTHAPLGAVDAFFNLQRYIRPLVGRIRQPTLAVFAAGDETAPPAVNRKWLSRFEAAASVEEYTLPRSKHVMCQDVDKEELARVAIDFCTRMAEQKAPQLSAG